MPVLAPLVVDRTKALLSRARLDEIAEGVAGFERRLWLDEGIAATMGLNLAETLAVAEGLGVALRAKPKVAAAAHAGRSRRSDRAAFRARHRAKSCRGLKAMLRAKA